MTDAPLTTMISPDERALLTRLARDEYRGIGSIIDAGCFLGGSTEALARGLRDNEAVTAGRGVARIHSYDRFHTDGADWSEELARPYGLTLGQSFRRQFDATIEPWADLVDVHEGDLLEASWDDTPVEILFLDICKTAQLHDHAIDLWFPRLLAGRSHVIQQDWGYRDYGYGNIAMEALAEFFEVIADIPYASRLYRCIATPTADAIRAAHHDAIAPERRRILMDRALSSTARPDFRAQLAFSSAHLALEQGDHGRALHDLSEVFGHGDDTLSQAAHDRFGPLLVGPGALGRPGWTADPRLRVISQMSADESNLLHALALALRPRRSLEVGRARGGSTTVLADAISHVDGAVLVSLDPGTLPTHATNPALVQRLEAAAHVRLVTGWSPYDYGRCAELAGGRFDFVFIDANHHYEAVVADLQGITAFLEPGAHLLLHDAHFAGVRDGIRDVLGSTGDLIDCGIVCTAVNDDFAHVEYRGEPSRFGGLHLLRFVPSGAPVSLAVPVPAGVRANARHLARRIPGALPLVRALRRIRDREQR